MLDTFWVLVLPGLVSGYNIFFFRQFFLSMPTSIEEAALMDGCGRFRTFLYIFIPLSKAPMVVLGANVFIAYWNSYLWPSMTITQPEYMQIMQNYTFLQHYVHDGLWADDGGYADSDYSAHRVVLCISKSKLLKELF